MSALTATPACVDRRGVCVAVRGQRRARASDESIRWYLYYLSPSRYNPVRRMPVDKLAPLLTEKRFFIAGRATSLSSQIVAQVRDDLFEKKLKPGDFLGTEMELAGCYDVSRMAARDAQRALRRGIVDIKMGKGGGARIATGNPRLFAEALAVQLDQPASPRPKSWTPSARSNAWQRSSQRSTQPRPITPSCASLLADAEAALATRDLHAGQP